MQHYTGTHATSSRRGEFILIHTPTQAQLLQKVPERHHYTAASVKHGIPYLISTENNRNNNVAGGNKALYPNHKLFSDKRHDLLTNVSLARNFPCMCYEGIFLIVRLFLYLHV
jgi:hypothetical protein